MPARILAPSKAAALATGTPYSMSIGVLRTAGWTANTEVEGCIPLCFQGPAKLLGRAVTALLPKGPFGRKNSALDFFLTNEKRWVKLCECPEKNAVKNL